MQQLCSWYAHDHDTHVQEYTQGPDWGVCHKHFVEYMCFIVAMVLIFPFFPATVLPSPLCVCMCVLVRVSVHVHAWPRARGKARQLCPSPVFWGLPMSICGCVCAAWAWL